VSDAERYALKTVAVTGGARGIGRAIATNLMRRGMTVAIADIDGDAVAQTAEELGASVHAYVLDVTDAEAFNGFLDRVEEDLGPLDVLVNNAGIMPAGAFLDESPASTRRQWEINIGGVVNGSRAFLPRAIKRGSGHLINTSSVAGLTGYAGIATYSGTKFYVYGFSEALRTELRGTGVDISVVIPGFVQTELTAGIGDARFFRRITPEEVAAGVADTIARPRFDVCVPKILGPMNLITRMLPRSAGDAMLRWARADRLALDYDHTARAAYEARAAASANVPATDAAADKASA